MRSRCTHPLVQAIFLCALLSPSSLPAADCNGDGTSDAADLLAGRARDCNRNGLPDECDLQASVLTFAPPLAFPIGFSPYTVVAADLNGDGVPDLVTANRYTLYAPSRTLAVLLNDGAGAFGPAGILRVGDVPRSVAVSDLDGDGAPDLVSANFGSGDLSVLHQLRGGRFADEVRIAMEGRPLLAEAADFDGDRRSDLAVVLEKKSRLSLLGNLPGGTIGPWGEVELDLVPTALLEADFDGDGRPDLAARGPGAVSILRNGGNGAFVPAQTFAMPPSAISLAAADFDLNGGLDLAAGSNAAGNVWLFRNGGRGDLGPPQAFVSRVPAASLAAGDFNGDGDPDLARAGPGSQEAGILFNDGNGGFAGERSFLTMSSVTSLAAADLNADGHLDLAMAHGWAGPSLYLNDGGADFNLAAEVQAETAPVLILAADLNGDAQADVASVNQNGSASVLLSDRPAALGPPVQYPADFRTLIQFRFLQSFVLAIDFDGDLDLDLVAQSGGALSALLNNGDGTFSGLGRYTAPNPVLSATAADLDGDGNLDLVLVPQDLNAISVAFNNGNGTFADPVDQKTSGPPSQLAAADLDGDGRTDLATADYVSPQRLSVLLNRGNGTFADFIPVAVPGVSFLLAADLDGDGRSELIAESSQQNTFQVIRRRGNGTFFSTSYPGGPSEGAVASDLNSDGLPELVFRLARYKFLRVLRNRGMEMAVHAPIFFQTGEVPISVAAGDFDGDGKADLAAAGIKVDDAWNTGGIVSLLYNRTPPPASLDLDHDGVPDECARPVFHRGDPDGDGASDLSDAVHLLNFLFTAGPRPGCFESADADNDGSVDLSDPIALLNFLYLAGAPPAEPGPAPLPCGRDLDPPGSRNDLGCEGYDGCRP